MKARVYPSAHRKQTFYSAQIWRLQQVRKALTQRWLGLLGDGVVRVVRCDGSEETCHVKGN